MSEIEFKKYKDRGVGYHWKQIGKRLRIRNLYVIARYELILDMIKDEIKNKKVLDAGCGDGVLSFMLAGMGAKVTGIDNSEDAINFAAYKNRNFKNVDFLVGSVYSIPFEDNHFDYIISTEVIEHLKYPEKMLSEIKRVWNNKGKIIISTPIRYTNIPLDKNHYQEFFEEDLIELLTKYFIKIKLVKSHPIFWMEFQNKTLFNYSMPRFFLNMINLVFNINPFKTTYGWRYFTLQTAIIEE